MTPRFPTITAPLPTDPRVIALASSAAMPRREAYAAAVEVWQWLAAMADGMTVAADVDAVDAVVGHEAFGKRMLEAQLIGTADGRIVLPDELRQQTTARGADAVRPSEETPDERRRRKNREAQQRRRNEMRLMGAKPGRRKTPPREKRSLGHLAGCEVIVSEGPYGPFAMLSGAMPEVIKAGEKHWDIKTVTLTDVAPTLLARLRKLDSPSKNALAQNAGGRVFKPSADELQKAVDGLVSGSTGDTEMMADGDMSSPVIMRQQTSATCHQSVSKTSSFSAIERGPKPSISNGLGGGDMSSFSCDDAPSSSSSLISSSSLEKKKKLEEDKQKHERQQHLEFLVERYATAINMTTSQVWELLRGDAAGKSELSRRLRDAGIDSKTGLPFVTLRTPPAPSVASAVSPLADDDFQQRKAALMRQLAGAAANALEKPAQATGSPIATNTALQASANEQAVSGPSGALDAMGGKQCADAQGLESVRTDADITKGLATADCCACAPVESDGSSEAAGDGRTIDATGASDDHGADASADTNRPATISNTAGQQPTATTVDISGDDAAAGARDDAGIISILQEDLPTAV